MNYRTAFFGLFLIPSFLFSQVESEPNNFFSTADTLIISEPILGQLFPSNDDDYYVFDLLQTGQLIIEVKNVPEDVLVRLKLYDLEENELNFKNGLIGETVSMQSVLDSPGTYFARVYSLESNSQVQYSLTVSVDTTFQTPIDLADFEAFPYPVTVYPNPVEHDVTIHLNQNRRSFEEIFLTIADIAGRRVYEGKMEHPSSFIPLGHLPKGIYTLEIRSGYRRMVKKLIKV